MSGTVIAGRYEILGLLGEGGMARVHRALDRHLDREVALKAMQESVASDPALRERFRREARAVAGIHHPNLVTVHDFLDTPQGLFLVLELVEGEDLRGRLRRSGVLELGEAARIAQAVLAALQAAHAHGVIHRDLSARNVLLDREGRVRVSDFGLARVLEDRTLTRTGDLLGSVQYLAPELADGGQATVASDLYSVGCLLMELITGELPFSGSSPVQVVMKHLQEPPGPPSARRPGVPPALDQVVLRALAKEPERRFTSAEEMSRALGEALGEHGLEVTWARPGPSPAAPGGPGAPSVQGGEGPQVSASPSRDPKARPPSASRSVLVGAAWGALLLLLLGAVWWGLGGGSLGGSAPELVGQTLEQARARTEALGFRLEVAGQEPSRELPAGAILRQEPPPGTPLASRGTVTIWLSQGPETVLVPRLEGLTVSRAREELDRLGLAARIQEEAAEQVPVGVVARQEPLSGAQVTRGTPVLVVVSQGSGKEILPSLLGLGQAEAERTLAGLGLSLELDGTRPDAQAAEGAVLEQRPSPGVMVSRGQRVFVVLSRGRADLQAPDLVGKSLAEARELAAGLGLTVSLEGEGGPEDSVVWQSPGPGSQVSEATITVRARRTAVVPRLQGLTVHQARTELEGARLRLGPVQAVPVAGATPGEVQSQEPREGLEVTEGSTVTVFVADPSAPSPDGAPDLPPASSPSPGPGWLPPSTPGSE